MANGVDLILHGDGMNVLLPMPWVMRCLRRSFYNATELNATSAARARQVGARHRKGAGEAPLFTPKVWARVDKLIAAPWRARHVDWGGFNSSAYELDALGGLLPVNMTRLLQRMKAGIVVPQKTVRVKIKALLENGFVTVRDACIDAWRDAALCDAAAAAQAARRP